MKSAPLTKVKIKLSKTWEKLQALWIRAIYEKSEILQQNKLGKFSWIKCGDNCLLFMLKLLGFTTLPP